jgi:hypothetical protein
MFGMLFATEYVSEKIPVPMAATKAMSRKTPVIRLASVPAAIPDVCPINDDTVFSNHLFVN